MSPRATIVDDLESIAMLEIRMNANLLYMVSCVYVVSYESTFTPSKNTLAFRIVEDFTVTNN